MLHGKILSLSEEYRLKVVAMMVDVKKSVVRRLVSLLVTFLDIRATLSRENAELKRATPQ